MTVKVYSKDRIPGRIAFGPIRPRTPLCLWGERQTRNRGQSRAWAFAERLRRGTSNGSLSLRASKRQRETRWECLRELLGARVCVVFQPMNHVANGAVAHVDVPVQQPGSFLRRSQKVEGPTSHLLISMFCSLPFPCCMNCLFFPVC